MYVIERHLPPRWAGAGPPLAQLRAWIACFAAIGQAIHPIRQVIAVMLDPASHRHTHP
jgi:hypothetical protein